MTLSPLEYLESLKTLNILINLTILSTFKALIVFSFLPYKLISRKKGKIAIISKIFKGSFKNIQILAPNTVEHINLNKNSKVKAVNVIYSIFFHMLLYLSYCSTLSNIKDRVDKQISEIVNNEINRAYNMIMN